MHAPTDLCLARLGDWPILGRAPLLSFVFIVLAIAPNLGHPQSTGPVDADLLFVTAHPDDEGIFGGGVLPYYSQVLDFKVVQLTMVTRGSDGLDPLTWPHPVTGQVLSRVAELKHAVDVYAGRGQESGSLNAAGHYVTGNVTVVEGGLVDTGCCNMNPSTSWAGWGKNDEVTLESNGYGNRLLMGDGKYAAAYLIAREIRRYKPEIVATAHDFQGDYGHSNHTATAIAVVQAFDLAADANVKIDALPAWDVKKLYIRGSQVDDNMDSIDWGPFSSDGGSNSLFHDYWEEPMMCGPSARQVANDGLLKHVSQGRQLVVSVYRSDDGYERADGHTSDSEWWTLYRSRVGSDSVTSFSIESLPYENWARGNFLENAVLVSAPVRPCPPTILGAQ